MDHEIMVLRKKLQRARDNENLRDIFDYGCSLAACLTEIDELEEALSLYKECLKVSEKTGNSKNKSLSNRMIAETCRCLGYFEDSEKHVKKYLEIAQIEGDKVEEQRALAIEGQIYFTQAEIMSNSKSVKPEELENLLTKSLNTYQQSYAILMELTDINDKEKAQMKARLFQNKGLVLMQLNKLNEAQNFLIKSAKICMKEKFKDTGHLCYMNLGELYMRKEEYKNALDVYDKAYEVAPTSLLKVEAAFGQVTAYVSLDNLEKAKQVLKNAYKIKANPEVRKMLKHVVSLMLMKNTLCTIPDCNFDTRKDIHRKMGQLYCCLKSYKNGIKCYLNALDYTQKANSCEKELHLCYKLLCSAFKKVREFDKALFYCNQEIALFKKETEEVCKIYYRISRLHELNGSEFEEIQCAYEMAKLKCSLFGREKLKIKCLKALIRIGERVNNFEIVEKAKKELKDTENEGSDSSCYSGSDNEAHSIVTESDTPNELSSGSDFDIQEVLQESDGDNEEFDRPRERCKRTKYTIKRNEKGETDLHVAVMRGNLKKVRSLLDKGHPINVRDAAGWTPLHEGCNLGFLDIVNLLIERGADVNDRGGPECDGITPLHDAAANGKMNIINSLIRNGASVMVLNDMGETPLQTLLKWKKSTALDEEELAEFKNTIKALKSPLDFSNSAFVQNNHKNTEKNVNNLERTSKLSISEKGGSTASGSHKTAKIFRRKREVLSDEDLHFNDSEKYSKSSFKGKEDASSIKMYREAIENLRHKPKKFKSSETKKMKRRALIDESEYVENFITDSDEGLRSDEDSGSDEDDIDTVIGFREEKNKNKKHKRFIKPKKNVNLLNDDLKFADSFNMSNGRDSSDEEETNKKNLGATRDSIECDSPQSLSLNSGNNSSLVYGSSNLSQPTDTGIVNINVEILGKMLKISVKEREIENLKVQWLINEVGKEYPFVRNSDYYICVKSNIDPDVSESDPLIKIANEKVEFVIKKWKLFPLGERYEKVCTRKNHIDITPELMSSTFKYTALHRVVEILKDPSLPVSRCINLSNLKLSSMTLVPICKSLKYESFIQVLNLSNNYFGDKGIELIVKIFNNCIIEELNLSECNITSAGVYHLSDSLNRMNEFTRNGLQVLKLSKNKITEDAVEAIENIIEKLPNLTALHIDGCELETKISANLSPSLSIVQDNS